MTRATQIIEIIAEELKLPHDASLNEVLACLYFIDKDGEIMKLLVEAGAKDIIEKIKGE
jgi:hypothetical protein